VQALHASGKWSFPDFVEQLRLNDAESRNKNHVSEAYLAAEELSRYSRVLSIRESQLFLGQAIGEGALVYFWCPAGQDGGPAKSIVAAANWCTTVEAAVRADSGALDRTIHLVVDEYAQIAASGSTTEAILNMARKWNVRLYFLLQSWGQVPDDLKDVLRTNCQMCVFDAYNRDDQDWLRSLSKDVYAPDSRSTQVSGFSRASETQGERIEPRLSRNEILEVSGTKSQFFLFLKLGDKYREPIVARVKPAVSLDEHNRLKRKPLPRLKQPLQSASKEGRGFELVPDPGLLELMNRIQAEHAW
jgi:hypothetical protein